MTPAPATEPPAARGSPLRRPLFWALLTAMVCWALDQASKWWILTVVQPAPHMAQPSPFPFVNYVLSFNTGVNFGLFSGTDAWRPYVLIAIAGVISLGLLWWASRRRDIGFGVAAGAVVGGALANAYDRATVGAVIDFLNVDCCGIGNPFAFNLADTAIFLGAVGLIWATWYDEPTRAAAQSDDG